MKGRLLNMREAADRLGFRDDSGAPNVAACLRFLDRFLIPTVRVGRGVRVYERDVEAAILPRKAS